MNDQPQDQTAIDATAETLDMWAYVELFGHNKIAGHVTERKLGTESMFQVDVMKPDGSGIAYSRLFSPKAIFSINPTSQEWCVRWAKTASDYNHRPIPFLPSESVNTERAMLPNGEGDEQHSDYDAD